MAWVKIDDDFYHHPKIRRVGPLGIALQVASLCYANHFNTKGFISDFVVETLIDLEMEEWGGESASATKVARWLVAADMWDRDDEAHGYWIHDYAEYQEPTLSEKRAAAGRVGGLAKSGKNAGEDSGKTDSNQQAIAKQPPSNTLKQRPPVPVPVPDPEKAAAAAVAREERPVDWQRAFDAWERQSPGSYNPVIGDALNGWLLDGVPADWIETACEIAGGDGGRKPVKFVASIIRRFQSQGSTDDMRPPKQGGTNGRNGDTAEGERAAAALRDLEHSRDFGPPPADMAAGDA